MIELSKYDIKRGIKLPNKVTSDLAYFCGLMAGDGHINTYSQKTKNEVTCSGNPNDEKEFYDINIKNLFLKLFNYKINTKHFPHKNNSGTYGFRLGSQAIANYLVEFIGLPRGNKSMKLKIPEVFKENKDLIKNYIRGLSDTDFGLVLKKRHKKVEYYPVISLGAKSEKFLREIHNEIKKIGFKPANPYNLIQKDERTKKGYTSIYVFEINGHIEFIKWVNIMGLRHPKHLKKYKRWKLANKNNIRLKNKIKRIAREGFEFGSNIPKDNHFLRPLGYEPSEHS